MSTQIDVNRSSSVGNKYSGLIPGSSDISPDVGEVGLVSVKVVSGQDENKNGVSFSSITELAGKDSCIVADKLVLTTPKSKNGVSIKVYKSCIAGSCQCKHVLGGNFTQLKPCRFTALIFVNRQPSVSDLEVFNCVVDGVDIVSGEVQPVLIIVQFSIPIQR